MNLKWRVHAWIQRAGYHLTRIRPAVSHPYLDVLDLLLRERARRSPTLFFLQIGANDGVTRDPLHALLDRHPLRGLMVEPQPRVYSRLLANRGQHPGLQFENVVVGPADGSATLFVPKASPHIPEWLSQAASLDRKQLSAVLRGHFQQKGDRAALRQLEHLIESVQLPSLTVSTLLKKHRIDHLDLLVMDTVGYDLEILRQFPFASVQPAIIHYEHQLLSREDQLAALALLAGQGYSFCHVEMDTIAVREGPVRPGKLRL